MRPPLCSYEVAAVEVGDLSKLEFEALVVDEGHRLKNKEVLGCGRGLVGAGCILQPGRGSGEWMSRPEAERPRGAAPSARGVAQGVQLALPA